MNLESVMEKADLISLQIIRRNVAMTYSSNFYGKDQDY